MAARIWHRWRDMKDVSGEALWKLAVAYEGVCADNEAAADRYRAERLALRGQNETIDEPRQARLGVGTFADREISAHN